MLITPGSPLYYLILLLILGNLFALGIGVLMLVAPRRLGGIFKITDRWISMRRLTKPLDVPRQTDLAMLRYPRLLGAIMLVSAALILIKGANFISGVSVTDGGKLLARLYSGTRLSSGAWETLWLSLIIVIILGAVLAVAVGLMSLFKIGKLKDWATIANRWVSTRQMMKPLDMPHNNLDKLVRTQPRLWGGVITALALYSAVVLWWLVLRA